MRHIAVLSLFFGLVLAVPLPINSTVVSKPKQGVALKFALEHIAMRTDPALGRRNQAITNFLFTECVDNDEWIIYPDVDRDEDVVYAYHAINDK